MNECLPIQDSAVLSANASPKDARGLYVQRVVERFKSLGGRAVSSNSTLLVAPSRLTLAGTSGAPGPGSQARCGHFHGAWGHPQPAARFSRRRLMATHH